MDAEFKKLLQDTLALAQENNNILHEMRRAQRIQRFMTFLYWIFIVGSAVGAYYLIQPYVESLTGAYTDVTDSIKSFQVPKN